MENAGIPRKVRNEKFVSLHNPEIMSSEAAHVLISGPQRQKERGSGPVILKLQITVSLRCPVVLEIEDKWNRLQRMLLVGVANL